MTTPRFFLLALLIASPAFAWGPNPRGEHAPRAVTVPLTGAQATVAFSPNGDGVAIIVAAINAAQRQILVQAYGFTERHIIAALAAAQARGVDVRVILDRVNEGGRYTGGTYLEQQGIPVYIDDTVAIAHNKVMVIDGDEVVTGSFNFTFSAQHRNAENVLIIQNSPALARAYFADFAWRWRLSHALGQ